MVKKIEGGKRGVGSIYSVNSTKQVSGGEGAKAVDKTKQVERTTHVSNVKGTAATSSLGKVSSVQIKITPENRAKINRMVSEETDKLFSNKVLPEKDKEVLEKAIKMALDASVVEDE